MRWMLAVASVIEAIPLSFVAGLRIVVASLQIDALLLSFLFFFQAEDGIRDLTVTGVQTCALPISFAKIDFRRRKRPPGLHRLVLLRPFEIAAGQDVALLLFFGAIHVHGPKSRQIGRASCRGRV